MISKQTFINSTTCMCIITLFSIIGVIGTYSDMHMKLPVIGQIIESTNVYSNDINTPDHVQYLLTIKPYKIQYSVFDLEVSYTTYSSYHIGDIIDVKVPKEKVLPMEAANQEFWLWFFGITSIICGLISAIMLFKSYNLNK